MDVVWIIKRMKDYISRLYPVIYSSHFEPNRLKNSTHTACAHKKSHDERSRLIESSLRYGQNYPMKPTNTKFEPPSELTSFKPFSVSEMEF